MIARKPSPASVGPHIECCDVGTLLEALNIGFCGVHERNQDCGVHEKIGSTGTLFYMHPRCAQHQPAQHTLQWQPTRRTSHAALPSSHASRQPPCCSSYHSPLATTRCDTRITSRPEGQRVLTPPRNELRPGLARYRRSGMGCGNRPHNCTAG